MTPSLAPTPSSYVPHDPSHTVLYNVVADHLETFLASLEADPEATGLPAYVERESYDYLQCGILAHGFLRLGCDTCPKEPPPGGPQGAPRSREPLPSHASA